MSAAYLMKGKVYGERKHLLTFPLYAEIKYDEIRLHVHRKENGEVEFLSYAGKPLCNLQPWANAFGRFMRESGLYDLDCGVLVNGNFNDSYRWVRSSKGFPPEKYDKATGKTHPALDASMVEFFLFDVPHYGYLPFHERKELRDDVAALAANYGLALATPRLWLIHSEAELDAKFFEVREYGFEGLMVKTLDHKYEIGKRIDGWLKMKPEDTADGKITGVVRAISIEGVPLDRAGSIELELEDGSRACPAGIAHELGRDMWENPQKYIGQWVEFKYMERDRQGGYRHPSFVRFREDKQ